MLLKNISILVALVALLQLADIGNAANILFFSPMGTHSTRLSKWPLMEALAEKGHSVTFLSPFKNFEADPKKKSKIETYEPRLWAESLGGSWDNFLNFYEVRKNGQGLNAHAMWVELFDLGIQACELLWDDPEFIEWVKSSTFDLVVVETFMNECGLGLVHYWKAKLAVYSTLTNPPWYPDAHGIPDETSSLPDLVTMFPEGHNMPFYKRFVSALVPIGMHFWRMYYYFPALERATRKGLGDAAKDLPPFKEIEKNTTVVFMTQHYSMDIGRAYPPNIIPVGGNVVSKKVKPLPDDMAKFINGSENGFMYVSFGTVCDFTQFDKNVQVEFIRALGSFKDLRFVWKSHNTISAAAIPDNVFVTKWAPQQTVLAHPKMKGYITHSGMGSTTEAIHFSVPLVCIPVMGDQDPNCDNVVRKGAGVKVEIVDMKQKHLEYAINEILQNRRYRDGMTKLTSIFKDRPMPPLETAVWWTEYVLRHDKVHEFLAHPSIHQPWWKRRQIDVWITAAAILLFAAISTSYIFFVAIKMIFGGENGKQKLKSN